MDIPDDEGQVYVFFGADFTEKIYPVDNATIYANITLNGTYSNSYMGDFVASGDVNNDSLYDIIANCIGVLTGLLLSFSVLERTI